MRDHREISGAVIGGATRTELAQGQRTPQGEPVRGTGCRARWCRSLCPGEARAGSLAKKGPGEAGVYSALRAELFCEGPGMAASPKQHAPSPRPAITLVPEFE